MPKKLFLIDGNAILHRAYHALPKFKTSKGEITNAVFGFTSMLLRLLITRKPDYIAVTFDKKGPTFRHTEYSEYKATRVKPPQDLYDQLPRVKEIIEAFKIPIFELDGYEADDILGTLAKQAHKIPHLETYIVTGDMDTLQLVNHKTFVLTPHKGFQESIIYDEKKVEEKYGLKPDQIRDYKALHGDVSDNIPGVHGIGEKTAAELLKKFNSLEEIYKNLEKIPGKTREKLEAGKEKAFFSKKLVTIVENIPIEFNLKTCETHIYDREKLIKLFQELEFKSLLRRLDDFELQYADKILEEKGIQPSLF